LALVSLNAVKDFDQIAKYTPVFLISLNLDNNFSLD